MLKAHTMNYHIVIFLHQSLFFSMLSQYSHLYTTTSDFLICWNVEERCCNFIKKVFANPHFFHLLLFPQIMLQSSREIFFKYNFSRRILFITDEVSFIIAAITYFQVTAIRDLYVYSSFSRKLKYRVYILNSLRKSKI